MNFFKRIFCKCSNEFEINCQKFKKKDEICVEGWVFIEKKKSQFRNPNNNSEKIIFK